MELEQEELEKAPKFKARPLNKKVDYSSPSGACIRILNLSTPITFSFHRTQIFESKGELGVFCNTKKHATVPQEFHFATNERIPLPSNFVDFFDKVVQLSVCLGLLVPRRNLNNFFPVRSFL